MIVTNLKYQDVEGVYENIEYHAVGLDMIEADDSMFFNIVFHEYSKHKSKITYFDLSKALEMYYQFAQKMISTKLKYKELKFEYEMSECNSIELHMMESVDGELMFFEMVLQESSSDLKYRITYADLNEALKGYYKLVNS